MFLRMKIPKQEQGGPSHPPPLVMSHCIKKAEGGSIILFEHKKFRLQDKHPNVS